MEFSLPYEISNDLETFGVYDFGGKLTDSMTAHPKICPATGEMHFFGTGNIFEPHVVYHRADADGQLTINRPIDVPALTMMHDFALTADHVVFLDLPLVFDLSVALAQQNVRELRDLPYRWHDEYGARLGVLRRDDPYGPMRWLDIDPCFVFHIANAYDRSPTRILLCWKSSATPKYGVTVVSSVPMPHCGVGSSTWTPGWSRRVNSTTAVWSTHASTTGWPERPLATPWPSVATRWSATTCNVAPHPSSGLAAVAAGAPSAPSEAVFAPAAGESDELAGWYLTYVYDPVADGTDLVVIDASDFEGEPVARVRLPRRVPHGFHGNWIPD